MLHPTSVFASDSQQITNSDVLAYVSLLETNKPYVVNATKCPALHTLLLVANTSTSLFSNYFNNSSIHPVDTTIDCARLAVDNWLEIELNSSKYFTQLWYAANQTQSQSNLSPIGLANDCCL